ncbi:hypothetical protein C731_3969 [Mycolicibacterium hassiacum DSM 44199]|uniref:Uncharacterized protein n=1 Tax=Mycolicibacterium hassiacum (strain DSM 44199 / CIP 105218 / JCM 12690 / 3849) TaxID=1122247 RepID=K5BDA4_MYCHD|nr:hypothetical protein C731_3969 [Mycolicibacterium hassiacum DSM 44199]VCT92121.1 hypothetical protein MHAS_03845 [Mycolicibacterium hassiacum DSM 44199]
MFVAAPGIRFSPAYAALLIGTTICMVLAACAMPEPPLPRSAEPDAVHAFLTSPGADQALMRITTYNWPDDGAKPARYFSWIGPDATSDAPEIATWAGESAHVVAEVLADIRPELKRVSPDLINAYADALTPFQAAMVGYDDGMRGFGELSTPDDPAAARSVFAVIATNAESGEKFIESAYSHAVEVAAAAAEQGCREPSVAARVSRRAVRAAAALSGVAASVDKELKNRPPALWPVVNAMAEACLAVAGEPPQGCIVDYLDGGRLLPPAVVLDRESSLESYYQSQRDYVTNLGLDVSDFYAVWNKAAHGR